MVTMPPEAAARYVVLRDLLASGMDCMRINCAHDNPDAWARMVKHLRRAEQEVRRGCPWPASTVAGQEARLRRVATFTPGARRRSEAPQAVAV
jgi:pyruvate kinase